MLEFFIPSGFTLTIAEDIRGSFVTATLSRRLNNIPAQNWTSEIGAAVPVK